jgi:hypothetical protein
LTLRTPWQRLLRFRDSELLTSELLGKLLGMTAVDSSQEESEPTQP